MSRYDFEREPDTDQLGVLRCARFFMCVLTTPRQATRPFSPINRSQRHYPEFPYAAHAVSQTFAASPRPPSNFLRKRSCAHAYDYQMCVCVSLQHGCALPQVVEILKPMQGQWLIQPLSGQPGQNTMQYNHAYVEGTHMILRLDHAALRPRW